MVGGAAKAAALCLVLVLACGVSPEVECPAIAVSKEFEITVVDARTGEQLCDALVNRQGRDLDVDSGCTYKVTVNNAGGDTLIITHPGYRTRTIVLPKNECGSPYDPPSAVELTPE